MQSESIGELAKALCKVQGELKEPLKSAVNPFFKSKYADLASIWACARDLMGANGLSIVQTIHVQHSSTVDGESKDHLCTILMHASGEWIQSSATINPVKNDPQSYGSAVTYLRRYALAAMLGVSGEDDDGNAATKGSEHKTPAKKHPGNGVKGMSEAIKPTPPPNGMMDSLLAVLKEHGGKSKAERLTFLRSLIVAHTIGVDHEEITNPSQLKSTDISKIISGFTATLANELFKK